MAIQLIVRPDGISTTPRLLSRTFPENPKIVKASKVNTSRIFENTERKNILFLSYPYLQKTPLNFTEKERLDYAIARSFFSLGKDTQRRALSNIGIPTPKFALELSDTMVYIGRPFRHSKGAGWTIYTTNLQNQREVKDRVPEGTKVKLLSSWDSSKEYLCEVFPKTHEYRVILVKGVPIITLLKRNLESNILLPWNHTNNSSFVTVNNESNNRLRHTDIYTKIEENKEFFSCFDVIALDVMFNNTTKEYSVCEGNLCPSLKIQTNIERIISCL